MSVWNMDADSPIHLLTNRKQSVPAVVQHMHRIDFMRRIDHSSFALSDSLTHQNQAVISYNRVYSSGAHILPARLNGKVWQREQCPCTAPRFLIRSYSLPACQIKVSNEFQDSRKFLNWSHLPRIHIAFPIRFKRHIDVPSHQIHRNRPFVSIENMSTLNAIQSVDELRYTLYVYRIESIVR